MKKSFLIACFILPLSTIAVWSQARASSGQMTPITQPTESLPEDISAVASAQIEAIKKGLLLTPDQEKLWGPVETALKTISFHRREAMHKKTEKAVSHDFTEHMQHTATFLTEKAQDFSLLASSLQPFSSTLDEGQKRRLCLLVNPFLGRSDWKCLQSIKKNQASKNKEQEKGESKKQALNTPAKN